MNLALNNLQNWYAIKLKRPNNLLRDGDIYLSLVETNDPKVKVPFIRFIFSEQYLFYNIYRYIYIYTKQLQTLILIILENFT